ncbi:hypothetical protein D3C72_1730070 [compost metagenome]
MEAAHLEIADFGETGQIPAERMLDAAVRNVVLHEVGLKLLEQFASVCTPLRREPVLRVQEYLAIRLPDAVVLHPRPALLIDRIRRHALLVARCCVAFQVEQAAADEHLHRGARLDNAGRVHARAHLYVDQEVFKQAVGIGRAPLLDRWPRQQVGDQRHLLVFPDRVAQTAGYV